MRRKLKVKELYHMFNLKAWMEEKSLSKLWMLDAANGVAFPENTDINSK